MVHAHHNKQPPRVEEVSHWALKRGWLQCSVLTHEGPLIHPGQVPLQRLQGLGRQDRREQARAGLQLKGVPAGHSYSKCLIPILGGLGMGSEFLITNLEYCQMKKKVGYMNNTLGLYSIGYSVLEP